MHRTGLLGSTTLLIALLLGPRSVSAQNESRYAEEPTGGVHLPATPLAGEHDAFSVVANPAGLRFVRGFHSGVAIDIETGEEDATNAGPGVGLYAAGSLTSSGLAEFLPSVGFGGGIELLRPSRITLVPDPGAPLRITLGGAVGLGTWGAVGVSWHRFFDNGGRTTDGLTTWDAGISARLGAHWATGLVVRDLNAPRAGDTDVQRRYELELVSRPLGSDRLELALGGRVGEDRADVDGWLRWSARIVQGLYFKGELVTRTLDLVDPAMPAMTLSSEREFQLSAGLEISFGSVGASVYSTGARSADGATRLAGGSMLVRASSEHVPSILGRRQRIERVDLNSRGGPRGLATTLLGLRAIARDPAVVAVFVQIDDLDLGWASIQELRQALLALRQAGKRVFAYLVVASTREYFVASAADRIYLDPAGGLRLTGFSGTTLYFKGVFDKLGVAAEFEKIEEYKSAPESYTRTSPTEPALRMRNELYDNFYAALTAGIAQNRQLDQAAVRQLIDNGPYTAGDLLRGQAKGLIDAVATPDEIADAVTKELGAVYAVAKAPDERLASWALPQIAIIDITGDIVDGKSNVVPILGRRVVGSETVVKAITAARENSRVKAIVLRIDSPGGSALASELMARAVFKTRGVKPIICSMGDVAASGGYYAAAGCDVILAAPMTITGSIGIFSGKFDMSGLLARVGVSWLTYKRGKNADLDSLFRPYSEDDRTLVKAKMRYLYERFLDHVAQGRGMTKAEVDAVGRGRVWSGNRAREVKLVDQMGGLLEALALAKQYAGMSEDDLAQIVWLPRPSVGLVQRLLNRAVRSRAEDPGAGGPTGAATGLHAELSWPPVVRELMAAVPSSLWVAPDVPQARLPFAIVWE